MFKLTQNLRVPILSSHSVSPLYCLTDLAPLVFLSVAFRYKVIEKQMACIDN